MKSRSRHTGNTCVSGPDAEHAILAAIVKASPDSIICTDLEGRITFWNPGAEQMYGYRPEEIIGQSVARIIPEDRMDELDMLLAAIAQGEEVTYFDSKRQHKDGRQVDVSVALAPITDRLGNIRGATKIDRDITERKELEHQLHHDAFHDRLTGVANRSLFRDRLEHVVARAQQFGERYALFVVDLDNFKLVNDTYGHQVGDQLLQAFVGRVRGLLSPVDTLARFGGDEFALILEETADKKVAVEVASRIREALQSPFRLERHSLSISCSIGILFGDDPKMSADQALRNADLAVYEAKRQGKNQFVVFDEHMRGAESSRLYLEAELRRAVQERDFSVKYQPIVDLQSDQVVGCEALVRWDHDIMGKVSPERFIGVAEDTGLITPLGRYVLDHACASLASWSARPGFPSGFYISVNISPKEFFAPDLIPSIKATLKRHSVSGANVRLEVTENVVVQRDREATAILGQLQALGLKISLDDFGTGYSSLSYLHQLPLNVIKVDRSFIQRLPEMQQSREIVRSVLELANALGMEAVAEGAETEQQLDELRGLGFRWVQGFRLHEPMDQGQLEALFH